MITKFKLFEKTFYLDEESLAKLFSKEFIEEYFNNNFESDDDNIECFNFSKKVEYIENSISKDKSLQRKLIEIDPNTVEGLFDIMSANKQESIGSEYGFQKLYLSNILTNYGEMDEEDDSFDSDIKELSDKFGLNPKIAEEYKNNMILVDQEKYNL